MAISVKRTAKLGAWLLVAAAVATSPLTVSAVSDTENSTINATVNAVISMTTSGTVPISLTPTSGGVVSSASDTVTVSTNNSAGYELTLADSDATLTLTSGGDTIATNTQAPAAADALSGNEWGWAVASGTTGAATNAFDASYSAETNAGSSTTKWAGISATPFKIKDTTTENASDVTTVWYAARATTAQPEGVYSDTVTYTATTN